jgi:alkylation response protein AidB-like acyl-CoA dehydrogenase
VSQNAKTVSEQQSRQVAEAAREQGWRQPSFGRELFLGRLRLDLIHPHPRPTEEERRKGEAFLARLEAFLREAVDPLQVERDAKIPDEVVRGLGGLGAFGIKIDERHGGLGLSQLYYNRALALAASAHSSIAVLLSAHQSIGVPEPVRLFGTPEQQRRILPGVASDQVSAFLLTEPDVGSDGRATLRRAPRRHHRVHRRRQRPRDHRHPPQPVHGAARDRERRHRLRQRPRLGRRPAG